MRPLNALRVALGLSLCCSVVQAFVPLVSRPTRFVSRQTAPRLAAATTLADEKVNAGSETSSITTPKGSKNAWEVHKVSESYGVIILCC